METAAEAECVLAQMAFDAGDAPGVTQARRSRRRARARAPALRRARTGALAGRPVPDARRRVERRHRVRATEAERMATELGLDAIRADALATVGTARGAWVIHVAMTISRRRSSWPRQPTHRSRCSAPSTTSRGGTRRIDMQRAYELTERQYETARRYGHVRQTWWARTPAGRHGVRDRTLGRGARARRGRDRLRRGWQPAVRRAQCRLVRAAITFARGDAGAFDAEIDRSLTLAAEATDPQAKGPVSVYAAYLRLWAGDRAGRAAAARFDARDGADERSRGRPHPLRGSAPGSAPGARSGRARATARRGRRHTATACHRCAARRRSPRRSGCARRAREGERRGRTSVSDAGERLLDRRTRGGRTSAGGASACLLPRRPCDAIHRRGRGAPHRHPPAVGLEEARPSVTWRLPCPSRLASSSPASEVGVRGMGGAGGRRLLARSRPRFVHTAARTRCPACPLLSYADRPQRLYWSGIRPHWPLLSIGVPSGGAWFEPSTAHLIPLDYADPHG